MLLEFIIHAVSKVYNVFDVRLYTVKHYIHPKT